MRSLRALLRPRRTLRVTTPLRYLGPASVVVAARNDAATIAATVRSLVGNDYPGLEVIVVDDGSADGTADIVDALSLPGVFVLRQPDAALRQAGTGGADALQAGIRYARHDLVVLVHGGAVLEHDAIGRLLQHFHDPAVGAITADARATGFPADVIDLDPDRRTVDVRTTTIRGAFRRSAGRSAH